MSAPDPNGGRRPIEEFIQEIDAGGAPVEVTLRCGKHVIQVTTRAALLISDPGPTQAVLMGARFRVPNLMGRALLVSLDGAERLLAKSPSLRDALARAGWTYTPPPPPGGPAP